MDTNIQHNTKMLIKLYDELRAEGITKLLNYSPDSFTAQVIIKADSLGFPIKQEFLLLTKNGSAYDFSDKDDVLFQRSWGRWPIAQLRAYWRTPVGVSEAWHPHQTVTIEYDSDDYTSGDYSLDFDGIKIGPFTPATSHASMRDAVRTVPGFESALVTKEVSGTIHTFIIQTPNFNELPTPTVDENTMKDSASVPISVIINQAAAYDTYSELSSDGLSVTIKEAYFDDVHDGPNFVAGQTISLWIIFENGVHSIQHVTVVNGV